MHTAVLAGDHALVQLLNELLFGSAAATGAAAASAAAWRQQGHELRLSITAVFPGWQNYARRARVALHLRPRAAP